MDFSITLGTASLSVNLSGGVAIVFAVAFVIMVAAICATICETHR